MKLKEIFAKNAYPTKVVDLIISQFLTTKYQDRIPSYDVPKKVVTVVLPYLGSMSKIIQDKLRNSLKSPSFNCCDVRIVYRISSRMSHYMRFKERHHKDLDSSFIYKYKCSRCNSAYVGESSRHWIVRFCEHLGHSARTRKPIKGLMPTAVRQHWESCGVKPSANDFKQIGNERTGSMNLRRIQESLFIFRDKPALNRDLRSVPLYLFK